MIRRVIARYGNGGSYWKEHHHCLDSTRPVPASPSGTWQIWNEPNIMSYYGDQKATAQGYGRLLMAADHAFIIGQPTRQDGAGRTDGQQCRQVPDGL